MTDSQTGDGVRVESSAKRVRAYLGGELVADSTDVRLVWEVPYYPQYYFPTADVRAEALIPSDRRHSSRLGTATYFDVEAGERIASAAAWTFPDSPVVALRDLVRFDWRAMDAWFEEEVEVFVHPRDPNTRIDVLPSSRHVRVEIDGVVVAESTRPTILFETDLPPRYYLPKTDVRMDLLTETASQTGCPYKGVARYWSATIGESTHDDVAWSYPTPLPESRGIDGLVAFYNERVDLVVDGERLERPTTKFS